MPHSPLLRAIRHIAGTVHRRHAPSRDRRTFIAAGSALAASAFGIAPGQAASKAEVAVIGAGLAGLTAAYVLKQAGIHASVYEAADRVGGRCRSERGIFADTQIAERGGEFIDSVHAEIIALTQAVGLQLDDVLAAEPEGTTERVWIDGAPYLHADIARDFEAVFPVVQKHAKQLGDHYGYTGSNRFARQLDRMSIADWIDRHVPGGRASRFGQLLDTAYAEEYAIETTRLSSINLVLALAESPRDAFAPYAASDQRFHIRGGNDLLVQRLLAAMPGQIITGVRLTAIEKLPDRRLRLSLATPDKTLTARFDRVILALPFTLLRQVDLTRAGFRPLKLRAIRELPMGRSTKLQLQFDERIWNQRGANGMLAMNTGSFHSTWDVTRAQSGPAGILNFWSGGDRATAAGNDTEANAAQTALTDLEPVWAGVTARWNGRVIRDAWDRHPWSAGSYAYYPPGYMTTLYGIEPEPEGRCHFAGEHTSLDWQGYLNGAVESGQRAAREVLQSLGIKPKKVAAPSG
ncbi:MAG: FAD-dependent oxidoreductase [Burkholderiales bacterium]|nr:FAD-dependent oxidoreductase [Burkholderiales bacterium]